MFEASLVYTVRLLNWKKKKKVDSITLTMQTTV
jgi:hypothetical protein